LSVDLPPRRKKKKKGDLTYKRSACSKKRKRGRKEGQGRNYKAINDFEKNGGAIEPRDMAAKEEEGEKRGGKAKKPMKQSILGGKQKEKKEEMGVLSSLA